MPDSLHDRSGVGNIAAMLYSKRSNQDNFYKESRSLGGMKLPTIPVPGYLGITRGIDRREIGCSRAFGRDGVSYEIPPTPPLTVDARLGPKHKAGEMSYGTSEGYKERKAKHLAPLDRSEKARWLRRIERIAGAGKAPPHIPTFEGKSPDPIDIDFKKNKDYTAYHMFPPIATKTKSNSRRRPLGAKAKGFAPPLGAEPEHIKNKFSIFKLPTVHQVNDRKTNHPQPGGENDFSAAVNPVPHRSNSVWGGAP